MALERVLEIAEYIEESDKEKAEQWVESLFDSLKRREQFPLSGRKVPEIKRDEIREVFYESYRVIYKVKKDQVEVLTIRHMRQRFDDKDISE